MDFIPMRACLWPPVLLRSSGYLDRAGSRHRCGGDHAARIWAITRAEVAEENNALTHNGDNQGHDHG
jgi:hypothetical protein